MMRWVNAKVELASKVNDGCCNGGYDDAVLILTSIISAIASNIWPSDKGIDRSRFIEAWERFGPNDPQWHLISIPLLVQGLKCESDPYYKIEEDLVLTALDVDVDEEEAQKRFPSLSPKKIRAYSYANIVYKDMRCSYSHNFKASCRSDVFPVEDRLDFISYTNEIDDQSNAVARKIHIPFQWMKIAVLEIAKNAQNVSKGQLPTSWWIDASA